MRHGVIDDEGNILPESALPDFVRKGMNDPKARMFDRHYNSARPTSAVSPFAPRKRHLVWATSSARS